MRDYSTNNQAMKKGAYIFHAPVIGRTATGAIETTSQSANMRVTATHEDGSFDAIVWNTNDSKTYEGFIRYGHFASEVMRFKPLNSIYQLDVQHDAARQDYRRAHGLVA